MVDSLIYPVILGTDFLHEHHLRLDFTSSSVTIQHNTSDVNCIQPLWDATVEAKAKRFATAAVSTSSDHDIVEECSVPYYDKPISYEVPPCSDVNIGEVLREYKYLFRSIPGATTMAFHHIPITDNPIPVPPRRIPGHYKKEIEHQIHDMLQQGIIEESCSPWMAPTVFVRKKSGDIRLCVDYRELNKKLKRTHTRCRYQTKYRTC